MNFSQSSMMRLFGSWARMFPGRAVRVARGVLLVVFLVGSASMAHGQSGETCRTEF